MGIDFDQMNRERDAKLRFRILRIVDSAKSSPLGIRGTELRKIIERADIDLDDDQHLVELLMYLDSADYVEVRDRRTMKREIFAIETLDVKVTAEGMRFLARAEPADAMIDDGRIVK